MPIVNNGIKVESFYVNHKKMKAPMIRVAKTMETPSGDKITVFDLRFKTPNIDKMPYHGAHSMEHLMAGSLRKHLSDKYQIIDISGMLCMTGFYCSIIGEPSMEEVKIAWHHSMKDVISAEEIKEANIFQCGSYKDHSLKEAKDIAQGIIDRGIAEVNNEDILLSDGELDVINEL